MNRILIGDSRDTLRTLAEEGVKVQCCITSAPYWGLRSYLPDGHQLKAKEIGQERRLDCLAWARGEQPCGAYYICTLREVFALVRDVLAEDGTLWIVQGDSYHNGDNGGYQPNRVKAMDSLQASNLANDIRDGGANRWPQPGLKPKDLCAQPWRLALALQADGFWWRDEIIWHKRAPMPSSQRDRCTRAHEAVLMFSRAEQYFYDVEAIAEDSITNDPRRPYGSLEANALDPRGKQGEGKIRAPANRKRGEFNGKTNALLGREAFTAKRTKRSIWTLGPEPFAGAHYAVFPTALVAPMVLAGTRAGDTVLDPFCGTGTVGEVALRFGRHFIGIDIDERNERFQRQRTAQTGMAFA